MTAAAIAAAAGLDREHVVVGETVATWDDARLTAELPNLQVIARSTPEQKERLVRIARAAGRTVAVTGDGVNDAPALSRADVAVAMGSGTAVAREAADLVLGDDSFATLMYGLAEGRRIVDNVQKGLIFLLSTHVALLGFILIATIDGFGQPLLPIQILWLELFIDLSTSVAFELEKPEPDLMRRPPRRQGVPLMTGGLLGRIGVAGGFSAVAALVVMVTHPGSPDHTRWLAYTVLVCSQAVRGYANRSVREPIHRLRPNWFLLAAGIVVIAVQAAIPLVPVLSEAFRATPLDASDWAIVALIALGTGTAGRTDEDHWAADVDRLNRAMLGRVSLQIDHVTKRYGATVALDGLTFEVPRGEVFGFLGANGAGKTTTMRICLGIIRADAGEIRWAGAPVADLPRRTWGYLPEERGLYPRMGVLDQLVYFASLYGQAPTVARREALAWLDRFQIPDYAGKRAEELSKGNQQKVQFIAAILHRPEVLLMDEPFTGLDPINLVILREAFTELRDQGRTLIFSTHQMEAAEALCESVAIVDHGRLVAGGRLRDLKRASGRRWIRIALEGEGPAPDWLGEIAGVERVRRDAAGAQLELLAGADPGAILNVILARGASISHFEVVDPSLEALFIELVGRPADGEAPPVVNAAMAATPARDAA